MSKFSVFEDEEWKQKRKELEAQVAQEKGEILVRTKDGEEYMSPELYNKLLSLGQPVFKIPESGMNIGKGEYINKKGDEVGRMEYKKPFTDYLLEELTDAFKIPALAMQGFNNSYLNPIGLAQRVYNYSKGNGFETSFDYIQPENVYERVAEASGDALADWVTGVSIGKFVKTPQYAKKLMGFVSPKYRKYVKNGLKLFATGDDMTELASSLGSSVLPSIVNLEYPGEDASFLDKSMYYGGNFILSKLGGDMASSIKNTPKSIKKIRQNRKEALEIGNIYDTIKNNPLKGDANDILFNLNLPNNHNFNIKRGHLILAPEDPLNKNSPLVYKAHGNELKKQVGTRRNFGFRKSMYKHNMTKKDMMDIPSIRKNYYPVEISPRGQRVYTVHGKKYPRVLVEGEENFPETMSSFYYETKKLDRPYSVKKKDMQNQHNPLYYISINNSSKEQENKK